MVAAFNIDIFDSKAYLYGFGIKPFYQRGSSIAKRRCRHNRAYPAKQGDTSEQGICCMSGISRRIVQSPADDQ